MEGAATAVAAEAAEKLTLDNTKEILGASMAPKEGDGDAWDWQRVGNERMRGMEIAELYNGLDALNGEFNGEGPVVLRSF